MISFKSGNNVPKEFEKYIDGVDAIKLITSTPMMGLITLSNISKIELNSFSSSLVVAYVKIEDIPFLLLNFDNVLTFDASIFNLESQDASENALNLILIENSNATVLHSRVLGIKKEIIQALIDDTMSCSLEKELFIQNQLKYKINILLLIYLEKLQFFNILIK